MTDDDKVAELLKKYKPGFLPYPIFEQIARLVALPIVEFIPLRLSGSKIEVLLIERSHDDPHWPNVLHTPGTVIRSTDLNRDRKRDWPALERIKVDELKGTVIGPPQYIGSMLHESKRGVEQAQLYFVEVIGEPKIGRFYDVDILPAKVMESQVPFIREAVKHFKIYKNL